MIFIIVILSIILFVVLLKFLPRAYRFYRDNYIKIVKVKDVKLAENKAQKYWTGKSGYTITSPVYDPRYEKIYIQSHKDLGVYFIKINKYTKEKTYICNH